MCKSQNVSPFACTPTDIFNVFVATAVKGLMRNGKKNVQLRNSKKKNKPLSTT